jgi:hypothetical protein
VRPARPRTQLATRIDREAARLTAALTADRNQARDDAADARWLATIALIIGAAGLLAAAVVGGLALVCSLDGGGGAHPTVAGGHHPAVLAWAAGMPVALRHRTIWSLGTFMW